MTASEEAGAKESNVSALMSRVEQQIGTLEDAIAQLHSRLGVVLCPAPPATQEGATPAGPGPDCAVSERAWRQFCQLQDLTAVVRSTLTRLCV